MIAVMVLGIGLIGVGALVSVGALQAQRASIDDRKAILGQAETRDEVVRGFLQAENWLTATNGPYMVTPNSQSQLPYTITFPLVPNGTQSNPYSYNIQPVAIDPLMVAGGLKNGFSNSIGTFATNGNQLVMQRLTVNASTPNWSTPLSTTSPVSTNYSPPGAAGFQSALSQDDLKFGFATSTPSDDALPQSFFNSAGTKRTFTGQYSWLMTLVPVHGEWQPNEACNLMTMSIVVFNQRQFAVSPYSLSPPAERAVQVVAAGNGQYGFGGGDLVVGTSQSNYLPLRVGSVIMLGWMQQDEPENSSGTPTTIAAATQFGTRPMFRWYRIINAGPVTASGSNSIQDITVSGADLNLLMISPTSAMPSAVTSSSFNFNSGMFAFIYDGAVAVYERTVRLEGPSMWTN